VLGPNRRFGKNRLLRESPELALEFPRRRSPPQLVEGDNLLRATLFKVAPAATGALAEKRILYLEDLPATLRFRFYSIFPAALIFPAPSPIFLQRTPKVFCLER
jgi:hypothetical protein